MYRIKSMAGLTVSLLLSAAWIGNVNAATTEAAAPTSDFAKDSLKGWDERSFSGNTKYELVEENGISVLRGHTQGKASVLYKQEKVDLRTTPVIHWSWKVDRTFPNINEQTRGGDDFPARLYVVVKTGFLPWDTLAINYVWASGEAIGKTWPNPFTDKAQMIAVQSGESMVGNWVTQSRDVRADFEAVFGININDIDGFAVMVDGDNSKQEATAWFGAIDFKAQ